MDILNNKAGMALSVAAGGAIAWLAWHANTALIPLTLLFPPLALSQRSRMGAAAVALAYYGVSSLPVLQISRVYLGRGDVWAGILSWTIASGILSTPWLVFWNRDRDELSLRLPAALLAVTVPPIGIIGWASPLTAAGFLFPGSKWLGVLLVVLTMVGIGGLSWSTIIVAPGVSLIMNLSYERPQSSRCDWVGVNTEFGSIHASEDPLVEFSVAKQIQNTALAVRGRVIVFPELILRRWGEGTDLFWQPTFDRLRALGSTILIGAGLPSPVSMNEYRNAVVIRGADAAQNFPQRIPVPLAMWKPWGGRDRVPLQLFGAPTVDIAGERAAIFICYEQLLPWSYLSAAWSKPTLMVGVSSAYWTKTTAIPRNQAATLQAWGRLFRKPVISATNY